MKVKKILFITQEMTPFVPDSETAEFGKDLPKTIQENGFEITTAEFTRIPTDLKDVTPEQRETIDKMIEKLEEFDDVQNVYTNMKPE